MIQRNRKILIASVILALMPVSVLALEFRSVAVQKAVLYDAPASSAKKVLLLSQYSPIEVVVDLGHWLKVRDAQGALHWIEKKQLSTKHTVQISVKSAEIRQAADATSGLVATLEKDVVLELVDAKLNNGWLKIKHRDGISGYILMTSAWGF